MTTGKRESVFGAVEYGWPVQDDIMTVAKSKQKKERGIAKILVYLTSQLLALPGANFGHRTGIFPYNL